MKTLFRSLLFLCLSTLLVPDAWGMNDDSARPMDTSDVSTPTQNKSNTNRGKKREAEQEPTHEDGSPEHQKKRARVDTSGDSKDVKAMDESDESSDSSWGFDAIGALAGKLIPLQKEILELIQQLAQPLSFNDFLKVEKALVVKLTELHKLWGGNSGEFYCIKQDLENIDLLRQIRRTGDVKIIPGSVIDMIEKFFPEGTNDPNNWKDSISNHVQMLANVETIEKAIQALENHIKNYPFENEEQASNMHKKFTALKISNTTEVLQRTEIHKTAQNVFDCLTKFIGLGFDSFCHQGELSHQCSMSKERMVDCIIDIDRKEASELYLRADFDASNKLKKPIQLQLCFNSSIALKAWYKPSDNFHYIIINADYFSLETPYSRCALSNQVLHALRYENGRQCEYDTKDAAPQIQLINKIISILGEIISLIQNLRQISNPDKFKSAEERLRAKLAELMELRNKNPEIIKTINQHIVYVFLPGSQSVDPGFKPHCLVINAVQESFCDDSRVVQNYYNLLNKPNQTIQRALEALNAHITNFPFENAVIKSRFNELVQNPDTKKHTQIYRAAKNVFECLADLVEPSQKEQFLKDNVCEDVIIEIDEKEAPKLYEKAKDYGKMLDLKMPVQLILCFNCTTNRRFAAWYIPRKSSSDVHHITFNMNNRFEKRRLAHELGHALQDEKGIKYDDWNVEIDADLIAEIIMLKTDIIYKHTETADLTTVAENTDESKFNVFRMLIGVIYAEDQDLLKNHWPDEWAAFAGCYSSRSFSDQQFCFAQYLHNLENAQVKAGAILAKDRFYTHPPRLLALRLLQKPELVKQKLAQLGVLHLLANGGEPTAGSASAMDACEMDLGECCDCCR